MGSHHLRKATASGWPDPTADQAGSPDSVTLFPGPSLPASARPCPYPGSLEIEERELEPMPSQCINEQIERKKEKERRKEGKA